MVKLLKNNRSFSFLLAGRLVTNIGDSLYAIAALWLVYELGGSSLQTGLAYGLTVLPSAFSFLFGPLIDRFPKRVVIIGSQIAQGVLISVIPIATVLDILTVGIVLLVIPIASLFGLLAYYAENAAVPQIVNKDDLVTANSALSFTYQGVDLAFNALAGIFVAIFGAVTVITLDVLTFVLAVLLFLKVRFPIAARINEETSKSNYFVEIREGLQFAFRSLLLPILIGGGFINVTFGAALGVLPAFAELRGGAEIYGLLMAVLSAGVLFGSLISSKFAKIPLGTALIGGYLLIGLLWLLFVNVRSPILTTVFLGLACIPLGATNVLIVSLLQKLPPEDMVGRVFTIAGSLNTIGMPMGAVLGGWLATLWGEGSILGITGYAFIILAVAWWLTPKLRQLPRSEQILPSPHG